MVTVLSSPVVRPWTWLVVSGGELGRGQIAERGGGGAGERGRWSGRVQRGGDDRLQVGRGQAVDLGRGQADDPVAAGHGGDLRRRQRVERRGVL